MTRPHRPSAPAPVRWSRPVGGSMCRHGRVVPRRSRRSRRPPAVLALALAALLGGAALLDRAPEVPGPAIDWPAQGQAAYRTSEADAIRSKGGEVPVPIASVTKVMTA